MHRTDATDFDPDIGNGNRGFKETPPNNETVASANFWNAMQEEISQVIEDAGDTLRATGNADTIAQWGQLSPAIQTLIANAIAGLAASDINNDSGVPGADVKAALDQLATDITVASNDINGHIADTFNAHAASAIDNNSGVTGDNVKEALDNLAASITTNITNIGVNAANILSNTTQIAVNTSAIAGLSAVLITNVIQLTGQAFGFPPGGVDASESLFSNNLAVTGVKVGDVVLVTPTNRGVVASDENFITFEGVVASADNIKINAVNHDDTVTVSEGDLEVKEPLLLIVK